MELLPQLSDLKALGHTLPEPVDCHEESADDGALLSWRVVGGDAISEAAIIERESENRASDLGVRKGNHAGRGETGSLCVLDAPRFAVRRPTSKALLRKEAVVRGSA